jgi:hypothetical protein
VVNEKLLFLFLDPPFLLLLLLLLLNNPHKLVPLLLSLFSQTSLFLGELPLSGLLQIEQHRLLVFHFLSLFVPGVSLRLFECSLGAEGVDLRLSVLGFFLHVAQLLDFGFFFHLLAVKF